MKKRIRGQWLIKEDSRQQASDEKSDSSISNIDENDLEILIGGGYLNFFDAFEVMQEFYHEADK